MRTVKAPTIDTAESANFMPLLHTDVDFNRIRQTRGTYHNKAPIKPLRANRQIII